LISPFSALPLGDSFSRRPPRLLNPSSPFFPPSSFRLTMSCLWWVGPPYGTVKPSVFQLPSSQSVRRPPLTLKVLRPLSLFCLPPVFTQYDPTSFATRVVAPPSLPVLSPPLHFCFLVLGPLFSAPGFSPGDRILSLPPRPPLTPSNVPCSLCVTTPPGFAGLCARSLGHRCASSSPNPV